METPYTLCLYDDTPDGAGEVLARAPTLGEAKKLSDMHILQTGRTSGPWRRHGAALKRKTRSACGDKEVYIIRREYHGTR